MAESGRLIRRLTVIVGEQWGGKECLTILKVENTGFADGSEVGW